MIRLLVLSRFQCAVTVCVFVVGGGMGDASLRAHDHHCLQLCTVQLFCICVLHHPTVQTIVKGKPARTSRKQRMA